MLQQHCIIRVIIVILAAMLGICGCINNQYDSTVWHDISFRDIPGVTNEEIIAIESLANDFDYFVYGMRTSSESFYDRYGHVQGFTALFCDWLSGFTGIPFRPALFSWTDLIDGLADGTIDFTGELASVNNQYTDFYMTDTVIQRSVRYTRLAGSPALSEIAQTRPLRYAFLAGTSTIYNVTSARSPGSYEIILIENPDLVYDVLQSGQADAYFFESHEEANLDMYSDLVSDIFLPLIFSPVSLSTRNTQLQPIISVVQKFLRSGGRRFLTDLYNQGYHEYMKNKLFLRLTDEELTFIHNNPIVPFAAEPDNYPISFFDRHIQQWNGIAFDVLHQVEALTGLQFTVVNDPYANWTELIGLLENGQAHMISELIRTEEREGRFLWPSVPILSNNYALLSKSEHPYININEILFVRVGLLEGTAHAAVFRNWFPDHANIVNYENAEIAFDALARGDVDMVMARQSRILDLTNYRELAGYKANVVFDYTVESIFGIHRDEVILHSIIDKVLQLIDTNEISGQWMRMTYDYRSKLSEAQRPWLIGASVLFLLVLILISVLFIRSRNAKKELEKLVEVRTNELQHATEEAHCASRSKSAFLANMSHEIRSPLNVIIGLTDLVLEESTLEKNISDNLRKISNSGNTLLSIVNDILDFSKIESGKLTLMPVEYQMSGLINDITTLVLTRLGEKPVTFNLDIKDDLPETFFGDDLRIKQILNNLLSNAVKYTETGAITLAVHVSGNNDDTWLEISVSDTGMGISEENLNNLFTDYYQVESQASRKIEGTGLGLAITKRLTEMMDGKITAESTLGKGTNFHVRIRQKFMSSAPIGPETAGQLRAFRYREDKFTVRKKLVRPELSFAKVLVVDDMQNNLDVAGGLMGKYKMQVDCVLSGQEALERIRLAGTGEVPEYNVIFMDHMMPGMDGIETAVAIRELDTEYSRKVPIIALTANAIQGTEDQFFANGFQDFLTKPIDIMLLDGVIRKWICRRERDQD